MSPESVHLVLGGFALALGLVVGSFLNVVIARMPEDRSVVWPGSACPACGTPIRPYDNVPVLAWLWLRGRCRACKSPISPLYPVIELLTGLVAWLLFQRVVPGPEHYDLPHLAAFLVVFLFAAMLIAQTFIDVRHYIIPDELSVYAVPAGVAAAALLAWLGYDGPLVAVGWQQAVVGALAGGGVLGSVMGLYWVVRREEGMGFGDVKLLAMMGAFLGALPAVPFVLFVASVAGALVGVPVALLRGQGLRAALPFGPFLALAGMIWLLHGPELIQRWFPGVGLVLGL
ncbi:prepilin peptidase [Myxococcota bacterium]|nr:prepilin peptidase [Myxococcota bacterium]